MASVLQSAYDVQLVPTVYSSTFIDSKKEKERKKKEKKEKAKNKIEKRSYKKKIEEISEEEYQNRVGSSSQMGMKKRKLK